MRLTPAAGVPCLSVAIIVAALAAQAVLTRPASGLTVPPGFVVENAFPGVTFDDAPVQVVFLPDGRRFVVEQRGVVWVMTQGGAKLATPFIDLSLKVLGFGGRGMLGVVLDPDFATNRWVYFAYTVDPDSDGVDTTYEAFSRIERYRASAVNPDVADLSTRQVLIGPDWPSGIPMPDFYHTIGALRFAPDKSLLVASGDGAHFDIADSGGVDQDQFVHGRASPDEDIGSFRSLSLNSLGGKILRLDKETGLGLPSNPFWDGNPASARSRVWVYGVRNPYRFALRPGTGSTDASLGEPGTLYIGDTGWNTYESVHLAQHGGLNMGWPCQEGPAPQTIYQGIQATAAGNTNVLCEALPSGENPIPPTPPLVWWHHGNGALSFPSGWSGHSGIGGVFHAGSTYPEPYAGSYFVADFSDGWIRWVKVDSLDHVIGAGDFISAADGPVDIEWDPASGDLYYASYFTHQVRRIRYVLGGEPRSVSFRADSANGAGHYPVPGAGSPWKDLVEGHDLTLRSSDGDATSGWQGNGTVASPYRLGLDGVNDCATIPAESINELQAPAAASVVMWVKTGPDVARAQYLLEWFAAFAMPFPGMTLAISDGNLRVFLNPWVDVASIATNTWYQVAMTKEAGSVRVYVNGEFVYSGADPNLGGQVSEMVLGASTYRGPGVYGDFFGGAIAQFGVWPVALSAGEILASFQSSQSMFFRTDPKVVHVRADSASGTGPYPVPGAASPWRDQIVGYDAALVGFNGDGASGWQGAGTVLSPYRLRFDGVNDHVTIPAAGVPELRSPVAVTAALWIKTGLDVATPQYLLEWLSSYGGAFPGMTMAIRDGMFRVFLNPWVDVAPVAPDTWYYVTVAKDASGTRAYLNEFKRFSGSSANLGGQVSEIVLGASTFRGPGTYGEFFSGSIAQVRIWQRALLDPEVQEAFHESESLYIAPPPVADRVVGVRADSANGSGPYPIPGSASPWRDLVGAHDVTLYRFDSNAGSGWEGNGVLGSPYRLHFDGLNDRATIPADSVTELQAPTAATAALWFQTGSNVTIPQYLFEWVAQYAAPFPGMSLAIGNGNLRVFLNPWVAVAPVQPDT